MHVQLFQASQAVALVAERRPLLQRISEGAPQKKWLNAETLGDGLHLKPSEKEDTQGHFTPLPPAVQTAAHEAFRAAGLPVTRSTLQVQRIAALAGS